MTTSQIGNPVYINERFGHENVYTLAKVVNISPSGNTITVLTRSDTKRVFINGKEKGSAQSWRAAVLAWDVDDISEEIKIRNRKREVARVLNETLELGRVNYVWDDAYMRERIDALRKIADRAEAVLEGRATVANKVETGN